jgi:hypothetical protein
LVQRVLEVLEGLVALEDLVERRVETGTWMTG